MQKVTFHIFCFPTLSRSFATSTQPSLNDARFRLAFFFFFLTDSTMFFFFLEGDSGYYHMTGGACVTNQKTSQKRQELHSRHFN